MELMAAREGLRALVSHPTFLSSQNPSVELVSDSQYVLGLASGSYSPTKNVVLAEHVRDVCKKYNVKTRWVRGHAGDTLNMICDKLAKHGKDEMTPNKVLRRRAEKKAKQEAKKSRKRKKNDSSN
jgi:ribonuclease HI